MPHKRLQREYFSRFDLSWTGNNLHTWICETVATDLPIPKITKGLSKKAVIEEAVVTGDSSTGVYWKIVA